MLVYKCDGCGKILEGEVLYEVEVREEVPERGGWRRVRRSTYLHLCEVCFGTFKGALQAIPMELESPPWEEGDG